ncbi:MAG: UDP-N-acetylglucosamine 2-epimerase (non-hydrolyzing) [Sciscionella sp.]|nr:UDP-N-acetylglucosamine 2-epimerase (non-hydrolyzing) [Sciscionella sp.]
MAPIVTATDAAEPDDVVVVAGTRPEAIKVAPMVLALRADSRLRPRLIAVGQHPTMVADALAGFGLTPDDTLRIDRRDGTLAELSAQVITGLHAKFAEHRPAAVVVQGDTTTAAMAAQVAFWQRIPVVHLEAGLRSGDLDAPFPEEANRKIIGQIAALHLAPTSAATGNLARDGITGEHVLTIGNTVVDAVTMIAGADRPCADQRLEHAVTMARAGARRLLLVTAHRRENWGAPLDRLLSAVATLVQAHPDLEVVLPAHPNPLVNGQVHGALGGRDRVLITEPLPYPDLVRVLASATLVISDSGGIQEEAPSFGVPVLVAREVTERTEAVDAGCALLVGTDADLIVKTATGLLADDDAHAAMTAGGNPFGDGLAAKRGTDAIAWLLGRAMGAPAEFASGFAAHAGPLDRPFDAPCDQLADGDAA